MKNLFAYGTLMCEDIFEDVSGCRCSHVSGKLAGYRRKAVQHEVYPAIFPDENATVNGLVYLDLADSAWPYLDAFEGDMYQRQSVQVHADDGRILSAMTYVIQPPFMHLIAPEDWDFEVFLEKGKPEFQQHYKGYSFINKT